MREVVDLGRKRQGEREMRRPSQQKGKEEMKKIRAIPREDYWIFKWPMRRA